MLVGCLCSCGLGGQPCQAGARRRNGMPTACPVALSLAQVEQVQGKKEGASVLGARNQSGCKFTCLTASTRSHSCCVHRKEPSKPQRVEFHVDPKDKSGVVRLTNQGLTATCSKVCCWLGVWRQPVVVAAGHVTKRWLGRVIAWHDARMDVLWVTGMRSSRWKNHRRQALIFGTCWATMAM